MRSYITWTASNFTSFLPLFFWLKDEPEFVAAPPLYPPLPLTNFAGFKKQPKETTEWQKEWWDNKNVSQGWEQRDDSLMMKHNNLISSFLLLVPLLVFMQWLLSSSAWKSRQLLSSLIFLPAENIFIPRFPVMKKRLQIDETKMRAKNISFWFLSRQIHEMKKKMKRSGKEREMFFTTR